MVGPYLDELAKSAMYVVMVVSAMFVPESNLEARRIVGRSDYYY